MANEYVNKVEANNQTLIDLTSDTATAGDVLEGRTLHLASGAPAVGTYRPSEEIEARLEATVGHSEEKNLFVQQFRQGTSANTSTATAVCSLTVIPVEYNQTLYFHNENRQYNYHRNKEQSIPCRGRNRGLYALSYGLQHHIGHNYHSICRKDHRLKSKRHLSNADNVRVIPEKCYNLRCICIAGN